MKQDIMIVSYCTEHLKKAYDALLDNNMTVAHFDNLDDARARLLQNSPAFLLLDYNIKGGRAFLTETVRRHLWPRPFIIVSANFPNGTTRAAMLQRGADACIDSPLNIEEVVAIISVALRRGKQCSWTRQSVLRPCIEYRDLKIDPLRHIVTMREKEVALTAKEYDVLYFLAEHCGAVLTKREIFDAVWKNEYNPKSTNVSDQISSLRKKLGLSSKDITYIQTIVGIGYRFGALA